MRSQATWDFKLARQRETVKRGCGGSGYFGHSKIFQVVYDARGTSTDSLGAEETALDETTQHFPR